MGIDSIQKSRGKRAVVHGVKSLYPTEFGDAMRTRLCQFFIGAALRVGIELASWKSRRAPQTPPCATGLELGAAGNRIVLGYERGGAKGPPSPCFFASVDSKGSLSLIESTLIEVVILKELEVNHNQGDRWH